MPGRLIFGTHSYFQKLNEHTKKNRGNKCFHDRRNDQQWNANKHKGLYTIRGTIFK